MNLESGDMEIDMKIVSHISKTCPICLRESFRRNDTVFYGCVKSNDCKCQICNRELCQLHFSRRQNKCSDCFQYVNPKETKTKFVKKSDASERVEMLVLGNSSSK